MKIKFHVKNYNDVFNLEKIEGLTPRVLEAMTSILTCQFISELSEKIEDAEPKEIVELALKARSAAQEMILQKKDVEISLI